MYNLLLADLYKLRKSMIIKSLFAITTFSAVVMVLIAYLIPQGKVDASISGFGFMFSDVNMISILGALIAGVYICGDFDNKTIQDAIATGSSRLSIIVSKTAVFAIAIAFILIPYTIVTGVALGMGTDFSMGSIAVGFLHLLTTESGASIAIADIWRLLLIIVTMMVVYIAQLSVCVPLAFVLKKPVGVVAVYYGLTILIAQLIVARETSPILNKIFAWTPFGGNYTFLTLEVPMGDIFKALSVSLLFAMIMLSVAYRVFRKAEVK